MLTPSEGKEICERVMGELDGGREMTPEDVAALMQAAESGYAPAQNAYANVINNVGATCSRRCSGIARPRSRGMR